MNQERFWTIPNILTLSRLPLSVLLFVCIAQGWWFAALLSFVAASMTDWLDGWLARKLNQLSAFGRTFDPLIDKVMVAGAFIFLMPVKEAGLSPWMVTVVIGRELLITGIRGYVEALGKKFGADWFGKLKMILQCVVLLVILGVMTLRGQEWAKTLIAPLETMQLIVLYTMLAATIGSGIQYCWKAARLVA
ncbi:MAG: CDP-diacylglycerol--glycerol-3-phosphate 3-phosphatidyltransferase [Planctomycetes bacterium]|nr:CDP-diacylglycerol--glycerol-3-phosphate 3-phosphatidyltransferase [Planctomycetota bacterium]